MSPIDDTDALLSALGLRLPRTPSEAFVRGVMDRIAAREGAPVPRWALPALTAGLAAAALLIVLGLAGAPADLGLATADPVMVAAREDGERLTQIRRADQLDRDQILGLLVDAGEEEE